LVMFILARGTAGQPVSIGKRSGCSACRARLSGKRVKSSFFLNYLMLSSSWALSGQIPLQIMNF